MMSLFSVELDVSTLTSNSGKALTGLIHMRVAGAAFPEPLWDDFVVVVLSWWCNAILEITKGACVKTELLFMDGPFCILLHKPDEHGDAVIELKAGLHRTTKRVARVSMAVVRREILTAAQTVLDYCAEHRLDSDDVTCLKKYAGKLAELSPELSPSRNQTVP
ncbi:MAG: hypothetical protein GY832_26495 [Chloroflexi bacterium]|nr:hypothetical protein [Chloroflexota bacterium]